jgi:ATP-binding cassette subfamily F protein 3
MWRKQGGPEKTAAALTADLKPARSPNSALSSNSAHPSNSVILSEASQSYREAESKDPEGAGITHALHTVQPQVSAVPIKRLNPIKLKQLEDRLRHAEEEIPRLEDAIAAVENRLGNFVSAEQSQKDAAELDELRAKRATLLAEWEELSLTLEEQQAV